MSNFPQSHSHLWPITVDMTPQLCTACAKDKPRCAFFHAADDLCVSCRATTTRRTHKGTDYDTYETVSHGKEGNTPYPRKRREPRRNHR